MMENKMYLHQRNQHQQRGISLLEVMLSLVIVTLLLLMAMRFYQSARQGQQVRDGIALVDGIIAGYANLSMNPAMNSNNLLTDMINYGYLPDDATMNPWNGAVEASKGATPNQIKITLNGLPDKSCKDIALKLLKQTTTPGGDPGSYCSGSGAAVSYSATFWA
jgi:type II secretory pathway pseudopilin PulG